MGFKSFMLREAEEKQTMFSIASRVVSILSAATGKDIKYIGSGVASVGGTKNVYMHFIIDKKFTFIVALKNDSIKSVSIFDGALLEPKGKPKYYIEADGMKLTQFVKSCKLLIVGLLSGEEYGEEFNYYVDPNSEPENEVKSESFLKEARTVSVEYDGQYFATKTDAIKYLISKGMSNPEISKALGVAAPNISIVRKKMETETGVPLQKVRVSKNGPSINAINTAEQNSFESRPMSDDDIRIAYKTMNYFIDAVLNKKMYGMIISGPPGVGKSQTLENKIEENGLKPLSLRVNKKTETIKNEDGEEEQVETADTEYVGDYTKVKGSITTASFYEEICRNRHGLIIFDDCDSMFKSSDGKNLMKAMLDSKKRRDVSYYTKTAVFVNPDDDAEIKRVLDDGKVPKNVVFDGQFIAITNLSLGAIDPTIVNRVPTISVISAGPEIFKKIKGSVESTTAGIDADIPKPVQKQMVMFFEKKFQDNANWKPKIGDFSFRTFINACKYYQAFENDTEWELLLNSAMNSGMVASE